MLGHHTAKKSEKHLNCVWETLEGRLLASGTPATFDTTSVNGNAQSINLGTHGGPTWRSQNRDALGATHTADLYTFTLTDTEQVTANLTVKKFHAGIEVLDDSGTVLLGGGPTRKLKGIFADGTYTIAVQSTDGVAANYKLALVARHSKKDPQFHSVAPTPVVAQPPVAQPPVAQPPVAQPPVAQPPVAQPPVAQPPVAQPPVAQPPVAQPPVAQPPVAQPPVAQPPVAQPPVAQPPVAQPPVAQPPVAQLPVTQPPVTQPPVAQPPVQQPTVVNGNLSPDGSGGYLALYTFTALTSGTATITPSLSSVAGLGVAPVDASGNVGQVVASSTSPTDPLSFQVTAGAAYRMVIINGNAESFSLSFSSELGNIQAAPVTPPVQPPAQQGQTVQGQLTYDANQLTYDGGYGFQATNSGTVSLTVAASTSGLQCGVIHVTDNGQDQVIVASQSTDSPLTFEAVAGTSYDVIVYGNSSADYSVTFPATVTNVQILPGNSNPTDGGGPIPTTLTQYDIQVSGTVNYGGFGAPEPTDVVNHAGSLFVTPPLPAGASVTSVPAAYDIGFFISNDYHSKETYNIDSGEPGVVHLVTNTTLAPTIGAGTDTGQDGAPPGKEIADITADTQAGTIHVSIEPSVIARGDEPTNFMIFQQLSFNQGGYIDGGTIDITFSNGGHHVQGKFELLASLYSTGVTADYSGVFSGDIV